MLNIADSIQELRRAKGLSARALAELAGVSASTVTRIETGQLRPTLDVVERLLAALGKELLVRSTAGADDRPERREQRVMLELHREIAARLIRDPDSVIASGLAEIERVRSHTSGAALERHVDRWAQLLQNRDVLGLVDAMIGTGGVSSDMRQLSPFFTVLSQQERSQAIGRAAA